ncbi:hypothetical protein P692DRAFT_20833666, partial [Suillus brevipes Sb2]
MNDIIHHSKAQLSGGVPNQMLLRLLRLQEALSILLKRLYSRILGAYFIYDGQSELIRGPIREYHKLPRPATSAFHSVSTSVVDIRVQQTRTFTLRCLKHQGSGRPWKIELAHFP